MENAEKKEETIVTPAVTKEEEKKEEVPSQNPIDKELDKIKSKGEGRTRREKLIFTKNRIEKQLAELDEEEGIEPTIEIDDENAPVTIGMLKQLRKEEAQKTALNLADEIEDIKMQELVKYHLQNTIKSSGNPKEDYNHALALVNSVKNSQILEEIARKTPTKSFSSASGAPAPIDEMFEPTEDERKLMSPPWNLTETDIKKARSKVK